MHGELHGPPISHDSDSNVESVVAVGVEHPPEQERVRIRTPSPHVTLQADQSVHSVNTMASERKKHMYLQHYHHGVFQ